jgi:methylenetetrahydrofolate--tRNA-(uracil-5-)-methyltransferase
VRVRLYEMRPVKMTPAHKTSLLSELVCSNSFKSQEADSPAGQLKAEMKALGSLVIPTGEANSVPGGAALAVDRDRYASAITNAIEGHPLIEVVREEFTPEMAEALTSTPQPLSSFSGHEHPEKRGGGLVIATGPLTSEPLAEWLAEKAGRESLYFYDAVSPTVDASTIDYGVVFAQSRYEKGEGDDYLNCPFDKEQYLRFVDALVKAERVPLHDFEKPKYFAGCTPIEEIASKGVDSLRYGNLKPVGLTDPRTGRWPYAVVQLRPENREKTLYSLVACQNRLKWGVQKEVLQLIPGLSNAEFVRLGVIHRNTFIESPRVLTPWLEFRSVPGLFVAGQLTGVEGYVESAAMGIYVGVTLARRAAGLDPVVPPRACAYGSLVSHLQDDTPREFAPMNINWGLFPEPEDAPRKKDDRRAKKLEAARAAFAQWLTSTPAEVR